jgi:uncharacterized membrane protein
MLDKLDSSVAASIDAIRNVAPKLYEAAVDRVITTAVVQLPLWICFAVVAYIIAVLCHRKAHDLPDEPGSREDKTGFTISKYLLVIIGTIILFTSLGNYVPDLISPEMPAFKSILETMPK